MLYSFLVPVLPAGPFASSTSNHALKVRPHLPEVSSNPRAVSYFSEMVLGSILFHWVVSYSRARTMSLFFSCQFSVDALHLGSTQEYQWKETEGWGRGWNERTTTAWSSGTVWVFRSCHRRDLSASVHRIPNSVSLENGNPGRAFCLSSRYSLSSSTWLYPFQRRSQQILCYVYFNTIF